MKIVGAMQIGGNCSWILDSSLKNLSSLVDEIVVVGTGNIPEETRKIIANYDKIVDSHFDTNIANRIEWNDMNKLLNMAQKRQADWILFMDADETFEPRLAKEIRQLVKNSTAGMYRFKRHWLWKDTNHYRGDRPDKFSTISFNTYLVRSNSSLVFPNPAGKILKRIIKHVSGKEKLRPYFGRDPITGVKGKVIETDIILLHHAALNWSQFIQNQIWYATLISKRQPKRKEEEIVNQFYSIIDESTLKLEQVKPEWFE